jgi:hypothetical protein
MTTALIFLNAMGFFACVILIAANGNQTPDVAIHFTRAIQSSIQMFVVGAGLPLVAWEIAAAEFDRSNAKVKLLESWTTYLLLIVSWALFFIAAWRLPTLISYGLRARVLLPIRNTIITRVTRDDAAVSIIARHACSACPSLREVAGAGAERVVRGQREPAPLPIQ